MSAVEVELPAGLRRSLQGAYRAYSRAVSARRDSARSAAAQRLAAVANAGRAAHWYWTRLAAPCGISAERLRQITVAYYDPAADVGRVPAFPDFTALVEAARVTRPASSPRGRLSERERRELRDLAAVARTNTGTVPLDDPRRRASERFSELIISLRGRRVTWREMSEASGHTQVGLRMRAARYGLGSLPPSIAPYRRVNIHQPEAGGGAVPAARSGHAATGRTATRGTKSA
jgi:hypothetical protein